MLGEEHFDPVLIQFLFHFSAVQVWQKMEKNHPILIANGLNLEERSGEGQNVASGWNGQGAVKKPPCDLLLMHGYYCRK